MTFAETKVSLYFFIRILPIMGMNTCKLLWKRKYLYFFMCMLPIAEMNACKVDN